MKILSLLCLAFLTGCIKYENHGHYKFDSKCIKQGMSKEEVIQKLGAPLKIPGNDKVFYYMYTKVTKYAFGNLEEDQNLILRLEFENNMLTKQESFKYKENQVSSKRSPEPNMKINFFDEIFGTVGHIAGEDTIKENQKEFKK